MDTTRPNNTEKLLTLQEASKKLGVLPEILLSWNDYQILKPTITVSGQIGYTPEQIEQFIRIRQSFLPAPTNISSSQVMGSDAFSATLPASLPSSHVQKHHSTRLVLSLVAICVAITIGVVAEQERLSSLLTQFETSYQHAHGIANNAQTSNLSMSGPFAFAISPDQKADNNLSKTNRSDNTSAFANDTVNPAKSTQTATTTTASSQQNKVPTATIAATVKSAVEKNTSLPNQSVLGDVSTFASVATRPTGTDGSNSPFDKSGNIAGSPKSNTLAMDFSEIDVIGSSHGSDQITNNLRNQLILIAIAAVGGFVYFLKQPRKALSPLVVSDSVDTSDKILEIDQKMDGTVVLSFQGKNHKISKPELDSDSDQFIAKLMKLVSPGVKEIEYDTFSDDKLKFSAPLSRLVTRLGFVGVKRDLFFPRTSKNRVLFRKYITRDDLKSMNISVDKILRELSLLS